MTTRPAVVKVLDRTAVTRPRDFFVLLAIAFFADSDGTNAWPTEATIARYARMSKRNAQRGIAELIEAGELAVDYKAGRGGTNLYRVLCCAPDVDKALSTSSSPRRGQIGPQTWTALSRYVDRALSSSRGQSSVTQPSITIQDHPPTTQEGEEESLSNDHLPHPAPSSPEPETAPNGSGVGSEGTSAALTAERIRLRTKHAGCTCASPEELNEDGSCARCYGWPS